MLRALPISLVALLAPACAPSTPKDVVHAEVVPEGAVRLRVFFAPAAMPDEASFRVEFAHAPVALIAGPVDASLAADGHSVEWRGTIGPEGLDLVLEPEHMTSRVTFAFERAGAGPVQDRVHLGRRPVSTTWAIPVYEPAAGRAPVCPELALVHDERATLIDVAVQPSVPAPVRVELCFAEPGYAKQLELVPLEGFGEPSSIGRRYWVEADAVPFARVAAKRRSEDTDILAVVHIDDRWPDPTKVSLDGHPVETDVCRFMLPMPPDGRIGEALVERVDPQELPLGAIAVWIEHGAESIEVDTSVFDAADG